MAASTPSSLLCLLLMISAFSSIGTTTAANVPPTAPVAPSTACNPTPYPSFCRSSVLPGNSSANLYDFGRLTITRSLSAALRFSSLVNSYLTRASSLTPTATRALQDCQLLSGLNIDYLSSARASLNPTQTLPDSQADEVQALLAAVITNQQTCMDGLQDTSSAWRVKNGLSVPLSNGTKLYSVGLSLFTRAWVPKRTRGAGGGARGHFHKGRDVRAELLQDGKLAARMSHAHRKVYESRSRRTLLQTSDSVTVSDVVIVSQDGTGNFTTITDALNAAPNDTSVNDGYFLIYVTAGVYEEYVTVTKHKKYVMVVGDGINQTIITGNRSVGDGWTTFNSATVSVVGQGFVATNITIRNTAGAIKNQAVALRTGADLSAFYSCSFEGYQDTLYTHSLRQFFRECDIYGTVDFIFGNAAVVFQNCNIYARLPILGQSNTITAQGRLDPNQNTGISMQGCLIKTTPELASGGGPTKTYLGRPWKTYSRTVIMESFLDGLVDPAGWLPWNGDFALSTLYYGEFNNTGPGSGTSGRVTWPGYHVMNVSDVSNFTVSSFILGDNWLPQTGVTYLGGLV